MSPADGPSENPLLLRLPTEIRNKIWTNVLSISEKENVYMSEGPSEFKQTILLSIKLTCRRMYFDIEKGFPKAYVENQTFSFKTLESFLNSVPLFTNEEELRLRSVHIQFYETPDFENYQRLSAVPYSRQSALLDELLLPKYHGIREWTFDVSNLFRRLGTNEFYKEFMQRHISYFLRYSSAENIKLVFNTCDGFILNCGQPRQGFKLAYTKQCTLRKFEKMARSACKAARRNRINKFKHNSKMLILHRPTQTSRAPNPPTPYHEYTLLLDDSRDPWNQIKAHSRKNITHESKWRMEVWERNWNPELDRMDEANAALRPFEPKELEPTVM